MSRSQITPQQSPSILVVDDQASMLMLAEAFLHRSGFERVTLCANVTDALDHLSRAPFDLVLSDVQMEPASGLDLLAAIRADPKLAAVRVVLMTSSLGSRAMRDAQRAGVDAYLTKPFSAEALRLTIEQLWDATACGTTRA